MCDVFVHIPKSFTSQSTNQLSPRKVTVLYFIPGNPGLIEYYFLFLNLLAEQSDNWNCGSEGYRNEHGAVVIAGASLGGFEATTPQSESTSAGEATASTGSNDPTEDDVSNGSKESLLPLYPPSFAKVKQTGTYTLQDQISLTYTRIDTFIVRLSRYLNAEASDVNVILAGHSVGAYIALEVIRQCHTSLSAFTDTPSSSPSQSQLKPCWSITSTLLLTPTISNIALSPSGRIATPLLTYLPFLPALLQLGASGIMGSLPRSWVSNIVRSVTGMKDKDMLDVTVNFLSRPGCVRQALEMAGHEMREITEGTWDDAVWGAAGDIEADPQIVEEHGGEMKADVEVTWKAPKHYFLFAKEDHWVADETREAILKRMHGRAKIVVDGEDGDHGMGIVHAWCLEQSGIVAGIVGEWMEEILGVSSES